MSLGEYFRSPQFQWSAYQSALSALTVMIAAVASYVVGDASWQTTLAACLLALIPILNRLREGVADAARAEEGKVMARDVKSKRA